MVVGAVVVDLLRLPPSPFLRLSEGVGLALCASDGLMFSWSYSDQISAFLTLFPPQAERRGWAKAVCVAFCSLYPAQAELEGQVGTWHSSALKQNGAGKLRERPTSAEVCVRLARWIPEFTPGALKMALGSK